MFERFTDRARRVVVLAQEEARMLEHNSIGTEHLLLGLIHEGEGVAAQVLDGLGVTLEQVRTRIEELIGRGQAQPVGHIPFTARAKKVLELSLREALQLGHNYIGTEHILLGLIREGDGVAAQVLVALGVELAAARKKTIEVLGSMGVEVAAVGEVPLRFVAEREVEDIAREMVPPATQRDAICPRCGTPLGEGLAVQTIAAEGHDQASVEIRVVFCATCGCALGVA